MQAKSIAECSKHSAILSTCINLPSVFKSFGLSIFEKPLKTGFTVFIIFSLTVKAATLIFISGCGSAISSTKQGKSGSIYNLVKY